MACRSYVIRLSQLCLISPSSFHTSPWYIGLSAVPKHTKYSTPTQGLCTYPSLCLKYLPPNICTDHPTFHSWICSHVHATIRPFLVTISTVSPTFLSPIIPISPYFLGLSWCLSPPALSYTDRFIYHLPSQTDSTLIYTYSTSTGTLSLCPQSPTSYWHIVNI